MRNRLIDAGRSSKAAEVAAKPGTAHDLSALTGQQHCLLVTFKRDGSPVPTPVWFGVADDKLYVRTESETPKVRRIRRDPHVRVGPCNTRGKPLGPLTEARAAVLPPDAEQHAEAAIKANYGKGRQAFERVDERMGVKVVYIEITPEGVMPV